MFGAAPEWLSGLRAMAMILVGAGAICATALAAPPPGAKSTDAPAKGAAHAEYVGSDTCASCHEEVAKRFATNPHTKMALMHGNANGVTCENCHGPGSEHVAGGGDVTKIFNPAKASAKEVDEKCLSCHAGAHPDFERSPHAKANVSCIGCHDIHGSKEEALLKAPQPTLCFQCHADQKPQFNMPFHHRVNEGLVKCSDCHDLHGTFGNSNLQVHGRSERDLHQVPHRRARAVCLRARSGQGRGLHGLPLAARFAERAAAEHAEHQHAVQPVPQPRRHGTVHGQGGGIGRA